MHVVADLELYARDSKLLGRLPHMLEFWKKTYPMLVVEDVIVDCHSWEMDQVPANRKKDRIRFIGNWLRRLKNEGAAAVARPKEAVAMDVRTSRALAERERMAAGAKEPGAEEAKAEFMAKLKGLTKPKIVGILGPYDPEYDDGVPF